ncbi:MAG: alpha/beta hydrolase [Acidobacteriota bacterium]
MHKTNLLPIQRVLSGLAVSILSLSVVAQQATDVRTYSPPGKLIDVGNYWLHINCTGKGSPTVVMEAGGGDFSLDWSLVQPTIAGFARICTYDRAGYGWSDPGPVPRTMQQIVSELHRGLRRARIKGPYVLVGQSFGGLLVRVYASQYPKEVVGMVLVDSSHEDMQIMLNNKLTHLRELSRGREIPPVQTKMPPPPASSSAKESRESPGAQSKVEAPYDKLPLDIQQMRLWAMSQPKYNDARRSEFDFLAEELARMYADKARSEYPLGDMPLIVLTRGKNQSEGHSKLQADLVHLSRNSKQIIAKNSGHHIQLDQPELVSDAIRQVVEAARHRSKLIAAESR